MSVWCSLSSVKVEFFHTCFCLWPHFLTSFLDFLGEFRSGDGGKDGNESGVVYEETTDGVGLREKEEEEKEQKEEGKEEVKKEEKEEEEEEEKEEVEKQREKEEICNLSGELIVDCTKNIINGQVECTLYFSF